MTLKVELIRLMTLNVEKEKGKAASYILNHDKLSTGYQTLKARDSLVVVATNPLEAS